MAVWELMAEAMRGEQARGHEWLRRGEIVEAVEGIAPETNRGTIGLQISFHCINDPSKRNSPGLQYRTNPILITDDPTMRGKRYRLITEAERAAFLAHPRDDLEQYSYTQVLEWLRDPATQLAAEADEDQVVELDEALAHDQAAGTALLELHLQDYLFSELATALSRLRTLRRSEREGVCHERSQRWHHRLPVHGPERQLCRHRNKAQPTGPTGSGPDPGVHGLGSHATGRRSQRPRAPDRGLGNRLSPHGDCCCPELGALDLRAVVCAPSRLMSFSRCPGSSRLFISRSVALELPRFRGPMGVLFGVGKAQVCEHVAAAYDVVFVF